VSAFSSYGSGSRVLKTYPDPDLDTDPDPRADFNGEKAKQILSFFQSFVKYEEKN